MKSEMKLLMLEDERSDAELIEVFLRRSGMAFSARIATDRQEFETAVLENTFDAILADNSLPQFSSVDALEWLQGQHIDWPFILVTGTVSEEFAVDILRKGADDYILKDNLTRLPSSIKGAIEKRITKREKASAVEDLRKSNGELRELSSHLQNVREEERIQIARDIHDELGQQLTGLKMEVYSLGKRVETGKGTWKESLCDVTELIEELITSVRKIASNLRPAILDDFGLAAAMRWQSEEVEARFGIKIVFTADFPEMNMAAGISTGLFRIYQEALTNAVRHANAHLITSSLGLSEGRVILEIKDDGKGIDDNARAKKKSLGLLGIKERVFVMDGNYELKSETGKGTSLYVSVPLLT